MRVFSGIQPTGELHIGNYLGAIKQWIELQDEADCFFCIVDLHAITTPYDVKKLQEIILEKAIIYLAAGLDPEKVTIFVQSGVKEHAELCWLLNTVTPLGELYRMTQYKNKTARKKKNEKAGLLNYPILMAADILLYDTQVVPVGEDQKQHVELTRDIARRFNKTFGDTFILPKEKLPSQGARIMSLSDPKKKMSKSDPSVESYISLFDSPDKIRKKIKSAKTDTGKTIKHDPEKKPGISNLLIIYALFSDITVKKAEKEMENKNYGEFKKELAELLVEKLKPFRDKREEFLSRKVYINEILKRGEKNAQTFAQAKIKDVRRKMGLS